MKVSAGLILRQELDRYLDLVIPHLLEFCDEVRVIDDGSTDGWEEILRPTWGKDGARVIVERWERKGEQAFLNHAAARNRLLQFTLEGDPSWIVASDADEMFSDGPAIRRQCEQTTADVLTVEMCEVWELCRECLCVREDGAWRSHPVGAVWRVAPFLRQRLSLRDRQTATGRVPDAVHGVAAGSTGSALFHLGWTRESERAERFSRYPPGSGHANAHVASIMWPASRVRLEGWAWPRGLPKRALLDRVRA